MYVNHEYAFRQIKMGKLFDWMKGQMTKIIYPVNSVYMSFDDTDPSTIFGGTWERVQGKFLLGASDSYNLGTTGGEATHTLSVNEMPTHNHTASSTSAGSHSHTATVQSSGDHTHTITAAGAGQHTHTATAAGAGSHNHTPTNSQLFSTNKTIGSDDVARRRFVYGTGTTFTLSSPNMDDIYQSATTNTVANHTHTITVSTVNNHTHTVTETSAGSHTHTTTLSTADNHNHTVTVGNSGGNSAFSTMPPYQVVNIWRRVA